MNVSACLSVVNDIRATESDAVLSAVDNYRAAGMSAADAQRAAANDVIAELEAERAELRRLIQEQHPDLFVVSPPPPAAPEPYVSRFFGDMPRQARDVTQTPEFKRWFGDSKVVDANGEPLVVYHGTDKDFSAFDPDKVGDNFGVDEEGFFFTTSTVRASGYADPRSEFAAAGMGIDGRQEPRAGANVMPVYLSIQNPLTIEAYTDAFYTNPAVEIDEQGISLTDYFDDNRQSVMEFVRRGAHDGVLFQHRGKTLAVALRPEQIKSAIGNRGTFDPADPDIRQSRSMQEDAEAQQSWLDERARSMGYRDIDDMVDRDFDGFMDLARQWRESNPAEALQARTLGDVVSAASARGVYLNVSESPRRIDLMLIERNEAPRGAGAEVMRELMSYADETRKTIYLDVKGGSPRLTGYYESFGFEIVDRVPGRPDWEYGMKRKPQRVRQARPVTGYQLPRFGLGSLFIERIQDRYNRWKQVVDTVGRQGGVVNEANDFYRAEERYWGKVAARIEDFDREVKQFVEDLTADGVDTRSMQLYAYAKHAKERNAHLRAKRAAGQGGFDSWSGMSDDDADAILDDARQAGLEPVFEKHHATLMRWTGGTRDVMLDEGLITDDQYLMLSAMFDNYVPLKGAPDGEQQSRGTGKGFNIRGKETERARGRYSEADNIIEHIIQDRVRALTRGGKNEVLRSFLQFVLDNPDPQLWEVNAVEIKPVMTVDDQGNQVIEEQRAVVKDGRTIGIKDGGREVFVLLKDEKLREQMQNLHIEQIGKVLGFMLAAQRMLGRLYTSLNPVFTVLNFARDAQSATFGMLDETGFRGGARLWKELPRSMVESFRSEFGRPSADYQLFRAAGGKTGFMEYRQIDELAKQLEQRVRDAERSGFDPRFWGPAALEFIEKINAGIENATRLAAFKAARSEGRTIAEASRISKNITVNFNRKGAWTPTLSAFFLFFNPAVQGSARIAQALKSPKVLATLGTAMTGVALLALQNASMGDDDDGVAWWDKIPNEVKDRNLIIVLPPSPALDATGEPIPGSRNGRYVKIPMPYGWNWFATIANQAVDVWRNAVDPARGRGIGKATARVASSFLGAYMPVQEVSRSFENTTSLALAAVPDFINAPVQSILNINAFGRAMYPDAMPGRDAERADSALYFPGQAGTIFQRAAEGLNEITGGSPYESGWLDFTPATLENLLRAYGGGPASFAIDLANAAYVRQSIARPDLDVRRLPFAKQLYGRIDAETDRMLAYERIEQISSVVDPIDAARRGGDMEIAREMAKEAGPMYRLGGAVKATRERLSAMRKEELAIMNGDQSEAVKYARLQALDAKRRKALQDLNRAYNAAMRQGQPPAQ